MSFYIDYIKERSNQYIGLNKKVHI